MMNAFKTLKSKISHRGMGLAAIAVGMFAIGYGLAEGAAGTPSPKPTPVVRTVYVTPAPTSPAPTPSTFFSNTTAWATYQSKTEPTLAFDYPLSWNVRNEAAAAGEESLRIVSPSGTEISWHSNDGGIGGGCPADDASNPTAYIDRAAPISGAPGTFIVEISGKDRQLTKVGVTGAINGKAPKVGPTDCLAYTYFISHNRTWPNSSHDRVRLWLETDDIAATDLSTIRKIFGSLKY